MTVPLASLRCAPTACIKDSATNGCERLRAASHRAHRQRPRYRFLGATGPRTPPVLAIRLVQRLTAIQPLGRRQALACHIRVSARMSVPWFAVQQCKKAARCVVRDHERAADWTGGR